MKLLKLFSLTFVMTLCGFSHTLLAQILSNKIFKDNIRSVQFRGLAKDAVYPILQLGSQQKLILSFDDLDGELKDYSFTLIHCDYQWRPSNLMKNEYIRGVFYDFIVENESSFNTYIDYTHYDVILPNDNIAPKLSGNYILKVYQNSNEDDVVLTQRFMVYEQRAKINTDLQRATYTRYYQTHQEVDVNVGIGGLDVMNFREDFNLLLMQNGRWETAITDLKPRFINEGNLDYNYEEENTFKAQNEFRFFDLRNVRFGGQNIQQVYQDSFNVYNALLYPDKDRTDQGYLTYRDFNGHRLIDAKGVQDEDVEGDYVWTFFRLKSNSDVGDVYVYGGFSHWNLWDRCKLSYNPKRKQYEGKILLKQGYYNYAYALEKANGNVDYTHFEGSFFQTENDYLIFFYQHSYDFGYDRIMGFKKVNSTMGANEED